MNKQPIVYMRPSVLERKVLCSTIITFADTSSDHAMSTIKKVTCLPMKT